MHARLAVIFVAKSVKQHALFFRARVSAGRARVCRSTRSSWEFWSSGGKTNNNVFDLIFFIYDLITLHRNELRDLARGEAFGQEEKEEQEKAHKEMIENSTGNGKWKNDRARTD